MSAMRPYVQRIIDIRTTLEQVRDAEQDGSVARQLALAVTKLEEAEDRVRRAVAVMN